MKRGPLIIALAVILIIGGFLTVQIIASGPDGALPVRVQTANPESSTLAVTPNQALAFAIFTFVAVGSLVGIGFVLSLVLRFLDKEITQAQQEK